MILINVCCWASSARRYLRCILYVQSSISLQILRDLHERTTVIMEQDSQLVFASTQDTAIHRRTAIVAEGGGQRGIYTAGILDTFLRYGFNPFEFGLGASAGAQNLSTYFLRLPGYAKRAIAELSVSPDLLVPYRLLGKRSVLDLDM